MYWASASPRSARTSSPIFWNASPISSICSGVSRASGCSSGNSMLGRPLPSAPFSVVLARPGRVSSLEIDLDVPLGGIHACSHGLALLAMELASAQIADLSGAQLAHAGVADAHAAAERQEPAGLLAADEDRHPDVARRLEV